MVELSHLIFTLIIILLAAYIVVSVFLLALEKRPNVQQDNLADTLKVLMTDMAILLVGVGSAFLNALSTYSAHLVSALPILILAGSAAFTAEMSVQYSASILSTYDRGNTKYFLPVYSDAIMPTANILRVYYDLGICWSNLISSRNRVLITETFDVMQECTEADWQLVSNRANVMATAPFKAIFNWTTSSFTEPFNFYIISQSTADFIASFEPMLNCACLDLSFAWNATIISLVDPKLHFAINNTGNAVIDVIKIPFAILLDVFKAGFYTCNEPTPEQQIICLSKRPPDLTPLQLDLDNAIINFSDWIDNVLQVLWDQFFEFTGFQLPRVGPLWSRPICIVIDVVKNLLDFLFHIDLVFGPSTPPKVHYLQFIDIDLPFQHAYQFENALEAFFDAWEIDIAAQFGCVITKLTNATINTVEFGTRSFIIWTTNTSAIKPYLAAYDKQPIIDLLQEAGNCTANMFKDIDVPLGQIANYSILAITTLTVMVVNLFDHIDNDFEDYITGQLSDEIDEFMLDLIGISVGIGNFFRQMSLPSSPGSCPLKNPADPNAAYPLQIDPFCCIGNGVESFIRIGLSLVWLAKNLTVGFLTQTVKYVFDNIFRLDLTVIPEYDVFIDAVACIPAYFMPPTACPDNIGTLQDAARELFHALLNVTSVIFRGPNVIVKVVRDGLDGNYVSIACDILVLGFYDQLPANILNILRRASQVGACITDSGAIDTVGTFFWDLFGWDNSTSIRNQFCGIIEEILTIIQFLWNFFLDPAQAIYNLIADLLDAVVTAVGARVTALVKRLQVIFPAIANILSDLFSDMFDCVLSCLSFHCSKSKCDFSNINLPNVGNIKRDLTDISYKNTMLSVFASEKNKRNAQSSRDTVYELRDIEEFFSGSTKYLDNERLYIPFFDNDKLICPEQYQMMQDTDLSSAVRHLIAVDYSHCLFSAAFARSIDILLLHLDPSDAPIVNPKVLYNPFIGVKTVLNLTRGIASIFDYYSTANEDTTWLEYCNMTYIDDPLTRRVGLMIDMMLRLVTSRFVPMNPIKAFRQLKQFVTGFISSLITSTNSLFNVIVDAGVALGSSNTTGKNIFKIARHVYNHNGWNEMAESVSNTTQNYHKRIWDKIEEAKFTKNQRIIQNRMALIRVLATIVEAAQRANLAVNKTVPVASTALHVLKRAWIPDEDYEPSFLKATFSPQSCADGCILSRDFIPCVPGHTQNCTACKLLTNIVDGYLNFITTCISRLENGIIVDMNQFLATTNLSTSNQLYTPTYVKSVMSDVEMRTSAMTTSNVTTPNSLNSLIVNGVTNFLTFFWSGFENLPKWLITDVGGFISNTNTSDPEGLGFWVGYLALCRYENMTHCGGGPKGIGLPNALLTVFLLYVGFGVMSLILPWSASLYIVLVPITTVLFFGLAYVTAPLCLMPTPIPTLPDCLADDSLIFMNYFNKPCLPWETFLPGLTTTTCPTASQDYTRTFVNCEEAPYNFVDGVRNIAFLSEWLDPSINEFLRTTTIPVFSWIYGIPYFQDRLTFDFGPTGVNDTWISCHNLLAINYIPAVVFLTELGIATFILAAPIAEFLIAGAILLSALLVVIMEFIAAITGYNWSRITYFKSSSELQDPKQAKEQQAINIKETLESSAKAHYLIRDNLEKITPQLLQNRTSKNVVRRKPSVSRSVSNTKMK